MLQPETTNGRAMDEVIDWATMVDEKDISDAARQWAENEVSVTAFPENKGTLLGMLEMAFEAGRLYQIRACPEGASHER